MLSKGLVTFYDEEKQNWDTKEFDDFNKSLDFFWDLKSSILMRFVGRPQSDLDDVKMPVWRWVNGDLLLTENDLN